MEDYFRRCFFVRTFADGNEKRVLRKLKNEFSIFKSPERDLTIGDVAHAQQNENKLSFAIDGHRLLSRLDRVQVNLTLCSLLHQFA